MNYAIEKLIPINLEIHTYEQRRPLKSRHISPLIVGKKSLIMCPRLKERVTFSPLRAPREAALRANLTGSNRHEILTCEAHRQSSKHPPHQATGPFVERESRPHDAAKQSSPNNVYDWHDVWNVSARITTCFASLAQSAGSRRRTSRVTLQKGHVDAVNLPGV